MNSFAESAYGRRICPWEFAFVLKLILVHFWCRKKQAILPGAPCEDRGNWD